MQRALTLVQMFAVAAMAANARTRSTADRRLGSRLPTRWSGSCWSLIPSGPARAGRRPLTTRYLPATARRRCCGWRPHSFPAPARFWVWAVAFTVDLGTPWLASPHSVNVPPDAAHLPERFGLFTLILLGESVVAVMQGMESQDRWTPAAAMSAFLGMGISFLIWWWYFDGALGASEQPIRSRRDALRFNVWSYAHFPLYLGIVVTGVGVQRIVSAASRYMLAPAETILLTTALAVVMTAMTAIGASSAGRAHRGRHATLRHLMLAALTLTIGIGSSRLTSAPGFIVLMAVACSVQLTLSLAGIHENEKGSPSGHGDCGSAGHRGGNTHRFFAASSCTSPAFCLASSGGASSSFARWCADAGSIVNAIYTRLSGTYEATLAWLG